MELESRLSPELGDGIEVFLTNEVGQGLNEIVTKRKKGGRLSGGGRSSVWRYFTYVKDENKSACKLCSAFVAGKHPGNLQKHLKRHPNALAKVEQELSDKRNAAEPSIHQLSTSPCEYDKNCSYQISPKRTNKEIKELLLEQIYTKKHLLFGPLSESVSLQNRFQEWQHLFEYGKNIGYKFPDKSDFAYLRDSIWSNLRQQALDKWDKYNSGDKNFHFTKADIIVLNILGVTNSLLRDEFANGRILVSPQSKETSFANGDRAECSWQILKTENVVENGDDFYAEQTNSNIHNSNEFNGIILPSGEILTKDHQSPSISTNNKRRKTDTTNMCTSDGSALESRNVGWSAENSLEFRDQMNKLLLEKKNLENEQIRLINYKIRLEIYETETRLGLSHRINL